MIPSKNYRKVAEDILFVIFKKKPDDKQGRLEWLEYITEIVGVFLNYDTDLSNGTL